MNGFRFWQYLLLLINNCTSYQSITAVLISSFDEAHIDFGTSSVKTEAQQTCQKCCNILL